MQLECKQSREQFLMLVEILASHVQSNSVSAVENLQLIERSSNPGSMVCVTAALQTCPLASAEALDLWTLLTPAG